MKFLNQFGASARAAAEGPHGVTHAPGAGAVSGVGAEDDEPFVNLSQISEIELIMVKRMREVTIGEHRSHSHGTGFDFVGLREWQPGDRYSAVDWPQSTLTNFSPMMVREFDQPSNAHAIIVADASLSTRCGIDSVPIAAGIARAIATIGLSAVFFQDMLGLVIFDRGFQHLASVRPRIGRKQVIHCLDAYQYKRGLTDMRQAGALSTRIAGFMRKASLVPVISDFLFDDVDDVLKELALLNSVHDVFLVLIDSAYAFELPPMSAGWIDAYDVDTGKSRIMSRGTLRRMAGRVRTWQDEVTRLAKDAGLDVLRLGNDDIHNSISLLEFVTERRLRKS